MFLPFVTFLHTCCPRLPKQLHKQVQRKCFLSNSGQTIRGTRASHEVAHSCLPCPLQRAFESPSRKSAQEDSRGNPKRKVNGKGEQGKVKGEWRGSLKAMKMRFRQRICRHTAINMSEVSTAYGCCCTESMQSLTAWGLSVLG